MKLHFLFFKFLKFFYYRLAFFIFFRYNITLDVNENIHVTTLFDVYFITLKSNPKNETMTS